MKKENYRFAAFDVIMIILLFGFTQRWGLGLNPFNLSLNPVKFGISWALSVFWLGYFVAENHINLTRIRHYKIRQKKVVVRDDVLTDLNDALTKLNISKLDNTKVESDIDRVCVAINKFQDKLHIMKQLLANHGYTIDDWDFIKKFDEEAIREILDFAREVIDTCIVFDDYNTNNGDPQIKQAKESIEKCIFEIEAIIQKYDEFLLVVKEILEKKLHNYGIVGTIESLDVTIDTVKQVYGLVESDLDKMVRHSGKGGTK